MSLFSTGISVAYFIRSLIIINRTENDDFFVMDVNENDDIQLNN